MKRVSLIVLVCLLAVPSATMAAQAAAPAQNAPISTWTAWFKSLRRPTRADALRAQQFVKSKWQCMRRGKGCSKAERNSLRALAAAAAAAVAGAVGYGVKRHRDQQESKAQERAQTQKEARFRLIGGGVIRHVEVPIRKMIEELRAQGNTTVPLKDILTDEEYYGAMTKPWDEMFPEWGSPTGVADALLELDQIETLKRLVSAGAINFQKHDVDLSKRFFYTFSTPEEMQEARDFLQYVIDRGASADYLNKQYDTSGYYGPSQDTLLSKAIRGWPVDLEYIKMLLEAGVEPTTENLFSAANQLKYAADEGAFNTKLDVMKLLVEHGSDPYAIKDEVSLLDTVRAGLEERPALRTYIRESDIDDLMQQVREALGILTKAARKQ